VNNLAKKQNGIDEEFWQNSAAKPKKGLSYFILFAVIFFLVFSFLGFYYGPYLLDILAGKEDGDNIGMAATHPKDTPWVYLLLGVDRREDNESGRSDTIMLAFLDEKTKTVKVLSIPRDTYAYVRGHGNTKINHAFSYGGPALIKESVADLLDLPVDRYVAVDFEGFKNIIDILGGVEIEVETRMDYPEENIDLYPGLQTLNGEDALAYVRWRGDATADLGRIQRQQKFMLAVLDKAKSATGIINLPRILNQVIRYVDTDAGATELLSLAKTFKDIDPASVETATLPGVPQTINGVSYFIMDEDKTYELIQEFYYGKTSAETGDSAGSAASND